MEKENALSALAALGQESRLDIFRLLIKAGGDGMLAGEIGKTLGFRPNTLSTNLSILTVAGLLRNKREGRAIRYFADFGGVRDLLAYLIEDCCGGAPEQCQSLLNEIACGCLEA
ncbi:ArsR/SmtB family transcription factor [Qingshengfaniella alkalisoli]|uniref:Helix-turn-helix transcriptional regulator n=1 Tax=Qingshengfaniella alkalisoli TaxID=2599296 RepID=A0A5B8J3N0_9RHOB|nr:helix-turn-helix domain-containing protein [Qingshengfaniella alkalisoli]QDY71681.1 helix-turn-helix transcriptional regulator [Qingshengfaniella alkalisoli]